MTALPGFLHEPFAAAMSQSTLLPAFFALFGVIAALFLLGFGRGRPDDAARLRCAPSRPARRRGRPSYAEYAGDGTTSFVDDDEYLEYVVAGDEPEPSVSVDEDETEPLAPAPSICCTRPQRSGTATRSIRGTACWTTSCRR